MLISTPAWAFLKMSFSSNKPKNRNHVEIQSLEAQGRTLRHAERATSPSVEYTDAAVSAVVDLVPAQGGVAVRLDPHSCHGVVKDFIVLDETQACNTRGVHYGRGVKKWKT